MPAFTIQGAKTAIPTNSMHVFRKEPPRCRNTSEISLNPPCGSESAALEGIDNDHRPFHRYANACPRNVGKISHPVFSRQIVSTAGRLPPVTFQALADRMNKSQTDLERFLDPLAKLAQRFPDVEGAVIWADGPDWQVQDDSTELLVAEEIAFYAEGLLLEGFGLIWQAIADSSNTSRPQDILLFFWQGQRPAVLPQTDGTIVQSGEWHPQE